MKLVKAYVRDYMAHKVVEALEALKAPRVTVMDAKALGDEIGHVHLGLSAEVGTYTRMSKIELICHDDFVEKAKKAIIETARTRIQRRRHGGGIAG